MKNMQRFLGFCLAIGLWLGYGMGGSVSWASTIVIGPSDDGSVYPNGNVVTIQYLLASITIQGVVEFPMSSIASPITRAYLSVNPYGLPLWDLSVSMYGYESSDGALTSSDYNAGTFLGTLMLPDRLNYGQDAFFDVTSFLQTVGGPYVGFNLRTDAGTDVFSSLESNYGHPAQLTVTMVPEPSTVLLLLSGILGLVGITRIRA